VEWLFLHGLLHLAGHDDATEAGAAAMDRRARRALQRAGG
jgi:ssRNA-specific RNase YbeY (16S rRNA maturation enzyme)